MNAAIKGKVDIDLIPDIDLTPLATAVVNAAKEYFNNPENQVKFEAWRKNRKITA